MSSTLARVLISFRWLTLMMGLTLAINWVSPQRFIAHWNSLFVFLPSFLSSLSQLELEVLHDSKFVFPQLLFWRLGWLLHALYPEQPFRLLTSLHASRVKLRLVFRSWLFLVLLVHQSIFSLLIYYPVPLTLLPDHAVLVLLIRPLFGYLYRPQLRVTFAPYSSLRVLVRQPPPVILLGVQHAHSKLTIFCLLLLPFLHDDESPLAQERLNFLLVAGPMAFSHPFLHDWLVRVLVASWGFQHGPCLQLASQAYFLPGAILFRLNDSQPCFLHFCFLPFYCSLCLILGVPCRQTLVMPPAISLISLHYWGWLSLALQYRHPSLTSSSVLLWFISEPTHSLWLHLSYINQVILFAAHGRKLSHLLRNPLQVPPEPAPVRTRRPLPTELPSLKSVLLLRGWSEGGEEKHQGLGQGENWVHEQAQGALSSVLQDESPAAPRQNHRKQARLRGYRFQPQQLKGAYRAGQKQVWVSQRKVEPVWVSQGLCHSGSHVGNWHRHQGKAGPQYCD